jgi:type I restriction enzyme M protein
LNWREVEKLSRIVPVEEAVRNDYNLGPSRYVATDGAEEVLPVEEAVVLLAESEEDRQAADGELDAVLSKLGLRAKIEA